MKKGRSQASRPPQPKMTMRKKTRTDLAETQRQNTSHLEHHFGRLPEDLFLFILMTVADLKSLFQCSLVSKHFASAVFRVRKVRVTFPSIRPQSMESFQSLYNLSIPKPLVFLEKFRELKSIDLEYKYLKSGTNYSFAKWKLKFSTKFPKFDRILGMLPASAHEHTSNESLNGRWQNCFWSSLSSYLEWLVIVLTLGKSHNSLIRVTINDSENESKMVIGEEHLVTIRNFSKPLEIFQSMLGLEISRIRWLRLPLSGYGMRWAVLLNMNYTTEPYTGAIDDIVSWGFDDEEKVLVEAIMEVYKNQGFEVKKK